MKPYTPLAIASLLALSGCDQISGKYEIVRAGSQTFLLNRSSGEAKVVDGVALIPVKDADPANADASFKQAKPWADQVINDLPNVKFKVRTKYRDGAMLWNVEGGPFPGELEKAYKATTVDSYQQPTLLIELYDSDGFKTGEAIELKIRMGTRTVNQKNEVYALSWTGTQPMTAETYRAASYISTRWFGIAKE